MAIRERSKRQRRSARVDEDCRGRFENPTLERYTARARCCVCVWGRGCTVRMYYEGSGNPFVLREFTTVHERARVERRFSFYESKRRSCNRLSWCSFVFFSSVMLHFLRFPVRLRVNELYARSSRGSGTRLFAPKFLVRIYEVIVVNKLCVGGTQYLPDSKVLHPGP